MMRISMKPLFMDTMMNDIIRYKRTSGVQTKSVKPITIEWKNARMVRTHSIKIASHEILTMSSNIDVVKINIVGDTGSGKTELAYTLAHLLHKESRVPFAVKVLNREDLVDIVKTVSTLQATNYILIFDDISFLAATISANKIKQIEQAFTELRHLPGGVDIKIIAIFNFHYTMAVSKYLRQSNAHFYTTIGSSDKENVLDIVGAGYISKVGNFIRMRSECISKSKFIIKLGNKGKKFIYDYQSPFAPAFFYNGNTARLIVFPLRTWISPQCLTCYQSQKSDIPQVSGIEFFDKAITTKFQPGVVKQAIRIKLYINGVSVYDPNVKRALRFIDKWSEKNSLPLEDLMNFYGLKDNATKLRVDPSLFDITKEIQNTKG